MEGGKGKAVSCSEKIAAVHGGARVENGRTMNRQICLFCLERGGEGGGKLF